MSVTWHAIEINTINYYYVIINTGIVQYYVW